MSKQLSFPLSFSSIINRPGPTHTHTQTKRTESFLREKSLLFSLTQKESTGPFFSCLFTHSLCVLKKFTYCCTVLQNYYGSLCPSSSYSFFFFCLCCRMILRQPKVWRNGWPPLPRLENRTKRREERKKNWQKKIGEIKGGRFPSLFSPLATHSTFFWRWRKPLFEKGEKRRELNYSARHFLSLAIDERSPFFYPTTAPSSFSLSFLFCYFTGAAATNRRKWKREREKNRQGVVYIYLNVHMNKGDT